jgi:predicted nucleic acid-binding protein
MIVIDASAVLEILKQTPVGLNLQEILGDRFLDAPHVIDLEVANVLRRWVFSGAMTDIDAKRALDSFLAMPITRHPHTNLLPEIWKLRHNLTAYDAAYLALARFLGAELLTMDDGLSKRAKRH